MASHPAYSGLPISRPSRVGSKRCFEVSLLSATGVDEWLSRNVRVSSCSLVVRAPALCKFAKCRKYTGWLPYVAMHRWPRSRLGPRSRSFSDSARIVCDVWLCTLGNLGRASPVCNAPVVTESELQQVVEEHGALFSTVRSDPGALASLSKQFCLEGC